MLAILADLRTLAQDEGALHEISGIIFRDWILAIDTVKARVVDEPEKRWSLDKLNNNELMLLLGLAVQSTTDRTFAVLPSDESFAASADGLLRELHDRIMADTGWLHPQTGTPVESEKIIGEIAREAIYYGADGFYLHQFRELARYRFRYDQQWMLEKVGISIRPIIDIAHYISDRITNQMNYAGHRLSRGEDLSLGDLTSSLTIEKSELRKRFGRKVEFFLAKFSIPAVNANTGFVEPFAVNMVGIAPLIDLGEVLYVPSQYRLFQSIYESPFYWMIDDPAYRDTASTHRGEFLEATAAIILTSVFGKDHVHRNVTLSKGKNIAGEVDLLVAYGEFVIIGQAKSKRVSLKARAGDRNALEADFKGAIQDPYDQALRCAELISEGARCKTSDGRALEIPALPRVFPMVLLSDHFPAATRLSDKLLTRVNDASPVIWDLGFLDCMARILASPIEAIYYLQARSQNFDKVASDSEFNFLGYHLRSKLALPDEADWMMLDRDFAAVVDDFMISADLGIKADRPRGVLEQLDIPVITDLFNILRNADPRLAGIVVDLYDFSSAALADLSATILDLREEVQSSGKVLKAFSLPTATGGLTYVVTSKRDARTARSAELLGAKHKYDTKSNRWYVILDSVETDRPVDGLFALIWQWAEDEDEAARSAKVGSMFNSRQQAVVVGEAAARRSSRNA